MHRIAPLRPIIVWSKGALPAVEGVSDGARNPPQYNVPPRLRQKTAHSAMKFGEVQAMENVDYLHQSNPGPSAEFYRHVEWRAGRALGAEERRSAILFTAASFTNKKRMVRVPKGHLLMCLAHACPADTQMNDIDSDGTVTYVGRVARSQWTKMHDADHVMVEDTAQTPSIEAGVKQRKLKTHMGHYMHRVKKMPLHAPVVELVCYAENRSLRDILHRVSYTTGFQALAGISWNTSNAEISRAVHACATQRMRFCGMTMEALQNACRKFNIFPLILRPVKYCTDLRLSSAGTQYTICLREVCLRTVGSQESSHSRIQKASQYQRLQDAIRTRLTAVSEKGFINYFPVQVVGGGGAALYQIGILFLQGNYAATLQGYLQIEAERHPISYAHYLQCLGCRTELLAQRLAGWADALHAHRDCAQLRRILRMMSASIAAGDVWEKTVELVVTTDDFMLEHVTHYVEALQGYIWNCLVNKRLYRSFTSPDEGLHVLPGDIVYQNFEGHDSYIRVQTEIEANKYSARDICYPVMGTGYEASLPVVQTENKHSKDTFAKERAEYESFLKALGLPVGVWSALTKKSKGMCIKPSSLRPIVAFPKALVWRALRDPNSSTAMKTDHFCYQQGNTDLSSPLLYSKEENARLQKEISTETNHPEDLLDLNKRIRPPTSLNHAPRFVKAMEYVQRVADTSNSIQLLPEPDVFDSGQQQVQRLDLVPYPRSDRCTLVMRFSLGADVSASMLLREAFDSVRYKNFNDLM